MKRMLILISVMAFVLTSSASASARWRANAFVSPTRNIHCHYYPYTHGKLNVITCMTVNNGRQVAVSAWGGRGFEVYNWPDPFVTPFTHVLYYGETYTGYHFQCRSMYTAMACRTSYGHGFSINRDGIQTW